MRRFDLLDGERIVSPQEYNNVLNVLYRKIPNDLLSVLQYYVDKGEEVCIDYNGTLLHYDPKDINEILGLTEESMNFKPDSPQP